MSRVEDITRALSDSFQEYDETLRLRIGTVQGGQAATGDHIVDVNDVHQVTAEQLGLSLIENYPIATSFVIDEQIDPNHYVDLQGAIHYIRTHLNLGQIVDSGDPVSPIGGMDINTLRPKLTGGEYLNAYGIERKHRRYQLVAATGDYDEPMLDVTVVSDDLVLSDDLFNVTEYKWRYKDIADDDTEGPWKYASFKTDYEVVLTPTLSVQGGVESTSLNPVFLGGTFGVNKGSDDHQASVWSLYDALGDLLETYTKTSGDLTEWIFTTTLEIGTAYRAEVYYTASNYEQSGVSEVSFETTEGAINAPTLTVPSSPAGLFSITLAWNDTDPTAVDNHLSSSLQIATDEAFIDVAFEINETTDEKTSIEVDNLSDLTTYYVRGKLHGSVVSASEWSPYETFTTGVSEGSTTEFEDPTGDFVFTSGTGIGQNAVMGGKSTQSLAQPVIVYRTPQGVQWAKRLTDIVTEGHITGVAVNDDIIYATGVNANNTKSFIVSLTLAGVVRWCKAYDAGNIMTLSALAVGDKVYAVGYSDGYNDGEQLGTNGVILALALDGTPEWAQTIGDTGVDRYHGVGYYNGYVVAVGDHVPDVRVTTSYTRCSTVTVLDVLGVKQWERHWIVGDDSSYYATYLDGSYVRVVGGQDDAPFLSVFDLIDGEDVSHNTLSDVDGAYYTLNTDGVSIYAGGYGVSGAHLSRLSGAGVPTLAWGVQDNQVNNQGFGMVTDLGVELVSRFSREDRATAIVSRIPSGGSVGAPPYVIGYYWQSKTPTWSSLVVTGVQISTTQTTWTATPTPTTVTPTLNPLTLSLTTSNF